MHQMDFYCLLLPHQIFKTTLIVGNDCFLVLWKKQKIEWKAICFYWFCSWDKFAQFLCKFMFILFNSRLQDNLTE